MSEQNKQELTRNDKEVLSHTIKNGFFGIDSDYSRDFKSCEKLVELGYMTKRLSPFGNEFIYHVTDKAKTII